MFREIYSVGALSKEFSILANGNASYAMYEILELFCEVFVYAVETNWTYEKRIHFYHAFPFKELTTKDAVMAFHSVLVGCRAFADFELKGSECDSSRN